MLLQPRFFLAPRSSSHDLQLMPKRRTAWSAWNYLTTSSSSASGAKPTRSSQTVSLTYNMNILQHIPTATFSDVLVTLNPENPPSPSLTQATYKYRHPVYNYRAVTAQDQLETIQGKEGIWYAGAWTGYGFHEDGCRSGIMVGRRLGGEVPWEVIDAKFMRGLKPSLSWRDHLLRTVIQLVQSWVDLVDRLVRAYGQEPTTARHAGTHGKARTL